MNMYPHGRSGRTVQEIWEDFSMSFTPAVREVVEFAKHIPGFRDLSQHDQVTLLKAGTFEVSNTFCCPALDYGKDPVRIAWGLGWEGVHRDIGTMVSSLTEEEGNSHHCLPPLGTWDFCPLGWCVFQPPKSE